MLLTCLESLRCITQALKNNCAEDVREAVRVLNQFPEAFENIDKKLSDPVLTDICRRLPELHFGKSCALLEKPVKTIQDAYFERTGIMLSESFCSTAYHTVRILDIDRSRIPAENCRMNSGMNSGMNREINNGINNGMNNGMNREMNREINSGMNNGINNGMNNGMNRDMNCKMNCSGGN
ncbi:MAG TPA: hypothetical protein O0X42_02110 [Methanocorpusculum sp.]|nr:hypothetical protein [Methanocorpusculum sp.]